MARKNLNLSSVLAPLENELQATLNELCPTQQDVWFDEAIDDFITKYGSSPYGNLDDLLNASALQASYQPTAPLPLTDLLSDLLDKDSN